MSIPVEKRDLGGEMKGWVLTCRGEDGGDLTLSDVNIRRENLICRVMGGDSIFFPMFGDDDDKDTTSESVSTDGEVDPREAPNGFIEESVLDDIREMLLQAQRHGCWKAGVGGVAKVCQRILFRSTFQQLVQMPHLTPFLFRFSHQPIVMSRLL